MILEIYFHQRKMFEKVTRKIPVILKPSELTLDIEDIVLQKTKEYENKHVREEKKVITKIISVQSIENTHIDEDLAVCLCQVDVLCEEYSLAIGEKLTLSPSSSNKNGIYFTYGPFEIFIANQSVLEPSLLQTMNEVNTTDNKEINMEISSIRFSDVNHKFIVLAQQT
jgi:DNA-directed RNA polymerase subunit E'/Rpb7